MQLLKISFLVFILSISIDAQEGWFWQNPLPQGNDLSSISFSNSQYGFAVGKGNTVLKTTDGGMNWIQLSNITSNTIRNVFSTSINTAFLVGDYGTILYTTDGGINWV
jgi:photosystem II stability/assembly factor-like uncharacterized protein